MENEAVGYLRVSGVNQISGDGFPRQREAIEAHAAAHGLTLVGEYRDEGVSGTKELDDRQGLSDLLARIQSNGVRMVLIERADRLARDLIVGEMILNQFRDLGVKVIAVDSGTELTVGDDDPTRTLIRQVLGAVSQFEKSVIVSKLKAARVRMRRETGRCEGIKPFGAFPGEQRAIAKLQELAERKLSFREIAIKMNQAGMPTRSGKPWRCGAVHAILRRVESEAVAA